MFINEAPGVYDVKEAEVLMEIFQLLWPTPVSSGLPEGF